MMSFGPSSLNSAVILGAIVAVSGCGSTTRTVDGECSTVFGSQISTWGAVSGGEVVEFGATVPLAAIEAAPADAPMVFPPAQIAAIGLSAEVRDATGLDHLGVNWEAHGHPPALYMTPHFDFHFYARPPAEIASMDCSNLAKPGSLPSGYALPDVEVPGFGTLVGLCVPGMGMHAMPETDVEVTSPFGAALLVGYYDRALIFLEPMISRAKLQEARSFVLDVPAVPDAGAVRAWPSGFEAVYDESARAYRFVFRIRPAAD